MNGIHWPLTLYVCDSCARPTMFKEDRCCSGYVTVIEVAPADSIGDRLYDALAIFDTRDGTSLADLVRAAREGYERSAMGESGAWDEFDSRMARKDWEDR